MNKFAKAGVLSLVLGVVLGIIVTLGVWGASSMFLQARPTDPLPETTIVLNAFHWGWVPQVLEAEPGVSIDISPGAQGSRVIVPQGTNLTLILRNAAGNTELHETFEDRFRDYFMTKYGEAWMNMHQAGHDDEMEEKTEEDEQNELLDHSFVLQGYDLNVQLSHEPEDNVEVIRFVADKRGEFRFTCATFCGLGHADMAGTFVVK